MKFDMGQAWSDAVSLLSKNRDLVIILAAVFLFLPSLALGIFAPTTELEAVGADPELMRAALAAYFEANWPVILVYAVISTIGTLAILALLGRAHRPTVGEAISIGAKTLIPYLAASFILGLGAGLMVTVIATLGAIAGAAIATLLSFVFAIAFVVIVIRLVLIAPVMAIDNVLNPVAAIKRSWSQVKGNTRRVAMFLFLLFVALLVLSIVVGMVFGILGALAPGGTISLWINAVLDSIIGAAGSAVFLAVYAAIHRQLSSDRSQRAVESPD